jgi:hypothetical protein
MTKAVLEAYPDFNIIGLMDEARTGNEVYCKPVISVAQAAERGVKVIVIIARVANVKIIYRRIADNCQKHSIAVYDISGNRLDAEKRETKSFDRYENISENAAKEKIDRADAISFDIFDTLLMRSVLYPRDVFELVAGRLNLGADFPNRRVEAEAKFYAEGRQPTIYDIYARLGDISPETEIEIEANLLVRNSVIITCSFTSFLSYSSSPQKVRF